jgi:transcriptional regulator with XRE-family HTH domain
LRVFRNWRDLSQSALAEAAKVSRVQIADIEAGRATGSVTTLRKLADALRIALDDLA